MIRVEVSLFLLVEVGGWAVVGGKCWDWVEADDCWDWLVGGLGISVGEGELCWRFFWAMVEGGSWTWAEVEGRRRFGAMKARLALGGSRRFKAVMTGLAS